jgi:hypothetical protein
MRRSGAPEEYLNSRRNESAEVPVNLPKWLAPAAEILRTIPRRVSIEFRRDRSRYVCTNVHIVACKLWGYFRISILA